MKTRLPFICLLFCFCKLSAQDAPPIQWQKCLGGNFSDVAYSIQETDPGYVIAGYATSNDGDVSGNHGNSDIWVAGINKNGDLLWQKCLGGSSFESAQSIQKTSDGCFIIGGWTGSYADDVSGNHGGSDYWMVKLDTSGNILWQNCFGGSSADEAYSIKQTADKGFILAGRSQSDDGEVSGHHLLVDIWVVKSDSTGALEWQHSLGGSGEDYGNSVSQINDGGYVVAGWTDSFDGDVTGNHGGFYQGDDWVIKLNAAGDIQWEKCFGGSRDEQALSIVTTSDGGYILAGRSTSNDGDVTGHHGSLDYNDYWVVKLDADGNIEWEKSFGGSVDDYATSVQQTSDGGFIVGGYSYSNDGDVTNHHGALAYADYWIVKLDAAGNLQWENSFGGTYNEWAHDVLQTADNGYILAGSGDSDNGDVTENHGNGDVWILKLQGTTAIQQLPVASYNFSIFPNPVHDKLVVKCSQVIGASVRFILYDISGLKLKEWKLSDADFTTEINTSSINEGFYLYRIQQSNETVVTGKLMIIK